MQTRRGHYLSCMTRETADAILRTIDRTAFKDASPGHTDATRAAAFAQALRSMSKVDFDFLESAIATERAARGA